MKRSGTVLIFVIVWVSVLFASYVIGVCVREVRFHRARAAVEVAKETETTAPEPKVVKKVERLSETEKLAQELAEKAPATGGGGEERFANRPDRQGFEAGQGAEGGRGNMRERFANMSEEERAQMRERMGGRRRGGERNQNMTEEERAQMEERRRQMRERFENMSEEERAQMRERMGGRGRPGGRQNSDQQENN
jgi:hypothetical protein